MSGRVLLSLLFVPVLMIVACSGGNDYECVDCGDGSLGCEEVTCSEHGECVVVDGEPQCSCDLGYHADGQECVPNQVDPCEGIGCSGHGDCVEIDGQATCECDEGYHAEGLSCVEDGTTGPCHGVDCSGHGTCAEVDGEAECRCDSGYHAEELECVEDPPDPCDGVTCSGNGACVNQGGQAVCECDDGYEPDGLECVETLCHCRERTAVHPNYCTYKQACTTAADCCPAYDISPYACNRDYPYVYECRGGFCENAMCAADSHCQVYFEQVIDDGSGEWENPDCRETLDDCTGDPVWSYCDYQRQCATAADCCPAYDISPYVCNRDYPHVYECRAGYCFQPGCTADSQCETYFQAISSGSPDPWVNDGCQQPVDPCTGESWYAYCGVYQACATAADCCPDQLPQGLQCNQDYPYLYRCADGLCQMAECSSDIQCHDYFDLIYASNPDLGDWVDLGCEP